MAWSTTNQSESNEWRHDEEAVSQPPIIIELSSVEDQFKTFEEKYIIMRETSADVQSLSHSYNTIQFNGIVKNKQRVAKGAEFITSKQIH